MNVRCISQVGYTLSPTADTNWKKALAGKWTDTIKSIQINQKLKITSGPNVHVVELNLKISDPLKACSTAFSCAQFWC